MATTVTRTRSSRTPRRTMEDVRRDVAQFDTLNSQMDLLKDKVEDTKKVLRADLDSTTLAAIEIDEKGNRWLSFDPPVGHVKALKHERRAKNVIDAEKASSVLRKKGGTLLQDCTDVTITIDADKMDLVLAALKKAGLYDEVVTTEEYLSEDKIMQAYAAETLSADDIDAMFTEKVTWAFVPQYVGRGRAHG